MHTHSSKEIPMAFLWRRLHSISGLFLVLFLCEHLLTNSQAALFLGEDGNGFIRMVNLIHSLPYLPAIEVFLLGTPILLHAVWGVQYLRTSKLNALPSSGQTVSMKYGRNYAYTWQRITSWILLIGITAHVVQMRFLEYPVTAIHSGEHAYIVRLNFDEGLYTLSDRIGFDLYDSARILEEENLTKGRITLPISKDMGIQGFDKKKYEKALQMQADQQQREWVHALKEKPLKQHQVLAVSSEFGTVILLAVRDTFKDPLMMALYTVYVLAAAFHAANGLWTFMVSWGITATARSQRYMLMASYGLMSLLAFLGLSTIYGTYLFNLYQ